MNKFIGSFFLSFVVLLAATLPGRAVPISFVYTDAAGEGFNSLTLGPARKACFEAAVNVYGSQFVGTVPIVVSASFDPLGGTSGNGTLGSASTVYDVRDWGASAPRAQTWYPAALANQLAGEDLFPTSGDVVAVLNSDVDRLDIYGGNGFYYGTDANPGNQVDFFSVVLHEMAHALGFSSRLRADGSFADDLPNIYDHFLEDVGVKLTDSATTNERRAAAATSINLLFNGPRARTGSFTNGSVYLYAPFPFDPNLSISHLDEPVFSGDNELMTPFRNGAPHQLGPVATGVFRDIGWDISNEADPQQSGDTLIVNKDDDHIDGTCSTNDCTLREAIDLANSRPGTQTINFNVGEGDVTLLLNDSLPSVTDPVVIQGPLAQRISLNGNNERRILVTSTSLTVQNLTFENGAAPSEPAGAFYVVGLGGPAEVNIDNCLFTGNAAIQGGAILAEIRDYYCKINITNSTFSGNTASGYGGAVFVGTSGAGTTDLQLTGCTFSGNTANTWGGGLALWKTGLAVTGTLTNCTFSGNNAGVSGGALVVYNGASAGIESSTFANNTAASGGAAFLSTAASSAISKNSLYVGNSGSTFLNQGTLTSEGFNMFSDNPDGFIATGDKKNRTTLASTLGPLANNGGPTETRALLVGSPAIDAGWTPLTVDQRGRPRLQNGFSDIGAYEYSADTTSPTVTVTSPANGIVLK